MVRIEEVGDAAGKRKNNNIMSTSDHAWDLSAADRLGRLAIEDHYDDAAAAAASAAPGAGGGGFFLDPREAERLVDKLETFGLEDVGSSRCGFSF